MEAAEFAIRVARRATGRKEVIGFDRSMHGKSLATARLGWDNKDGVNVPILHRLPYLGTQPESQVLGRLEQKLRSGHISAVFVEPMQGVNGILPQPPFLESIIRLARSFKALTVFDEILSGFHRTGKAFLFSGLSVLPSIVLTGKAMGNGFPVSAVAVHSSISIESSMLPGSTFSGNPLAAAAVVGTLNCMQTYDLPGMVRKIEKVIVEALSEVDGQGVCLRGKGAMWVLELDESVDVGAVITNIFRRGVLVNSTRHILRILPAATIRLENLQHACQIVRDEILRVKHG
jgi:acetylornithine/succinyldiaminopimelate/putrescine aminotransferase